MQDVIFTEFYKAVLNSLYDGVYFIDNTRKITYWNKGAERITGYKPTEIIGTSCANNILKQIDKSGILVCSRSFDKADSGFCTGQCPIVKSIQNKEHTERELFFHHKNGHKVPVLLRTAPILDAAGSILGATQIFSDTSEKISAIQRAEELQKLAYIDPLTGAGNRRYTEIILHEKLEEFNRYGMPFGVLFIDLDHFKQINDSYGHLVGDEMLKMTTKTMMSNIRTFDFIGRWGGEEFVAIILNSNEEMLYSIANRFRMLTEKTCISVEKKNINITISVGATIAKQGDTIESLIQWADALMYQSKALGRNCVTLKNKP